MLRFLTIAAILAAFAFTAAFAAEQPTASNHSGLVCFSILSPEAAKQLPADRQTEAERGWMAQSSCDAMCATRGAACVTVSGYDSADACAEIPPPPARNSTCRCCATRN